MKERYSEETINKLVRKALYLERNNKFSEALDIYYELASEENEFAIDRIPLVKYREEQFRLRKVNFFIGVVSAFTIGAALTTVIFSTINHILKTDAITKEASNTYISNIHTSSNVDYSSIIVNYHTLDSIDKKVLESTLDIFVPENITTTKLKERVQEGIETYASEATSNNNELTIIIKTYTDKKPVGYIQFNTKNVNSCDVFLIKQ